MTWCTWLAQNSYRVMHTLVARLLHRYAELTITHQASSVTVTPVTRQSCQLLMTVTPVIHDSHAHYTWQSCQFLLTIMPVAHDSHISCTVIVHTCTCTIISALAFLYNPEYLSVSLTYTTITFKIHLCEHLLAVNTNTKICYSFYHFMQIDIYIYTYQSCRWRGQTAPFDMRVWEREKEWISHVEGWKIMPMWGVLQAWWEYYIHIIWNDEWK